MNRKHNSPRSSLLMMYMTLLLIPASFAQDGGDEILFTSNLDGEWTIYLMNADGTDSRRLERGGTPSWSPDGTKIAFTSNHDGPGDIYVMDANGKNSKNLTLDARHEVTPRWSSDGRRIAFGSSWLDAGNLHFSDIFIINADGGNHMNLTQTPRRYNTSPSWSPDGKRIAYGAYSNEARVRRDIFVINADGTQSARLTEDFPVNAYPGWSPDGTKIAFVRKTLERDDSSDIYVMNADGSGVINITQTQGVSESKPLWRPTPFAVSSATRLATRWGVVKLMR